MKLKEKKTPSPLIDKQLAGKKYWLTASFVCGLIIVAITARPIFTIPQLEPDDYRYLHQVQLLDQNFFGNVVTASVVENHWDHLWWIDVKEKVRFFRPTIVLSYWMDVKLYGDNYALGLLVTNILIYLLCVFLVCLFFYRWLGPGISLLVSTCLFASFYSHGEVMWYVAGRTDSLAALFFLAGLVLHTFGTNRASLRWWALLCFVFAIFTKELTMVLPLILFLNDWLIEKRYADIKSLVKREWKLYAAYVLIILGMFWIRALMISGPDTGYPYPYFVSPDRPEFLFHLWGQMKSYCSNILFGIETVPFLTPAQIQSIVSPNGFILGICLLSFSIYYLRTEKKFWILLLMAFAAWLPTVIVYISERYLFLPTVAVAGTVGFLLVRFERQNRKIFFIILAVVIVWIGHQANELHRKNEIFGTIPRQPFVIGQQLIGTGKSFPHGTKFCLVNLPGDWLQAQFMQDEMRVQLYDPTLEVMVLSVMPETGTMGSGIFVNKENERTIFLGDSDHGPVMAHVNDPFPCVKLNSGEHFTDHTGTDIQIIDGQENSCRSLRCSLTDSIDRYTILKWYPDPNARRAPYYRELHSALRIIVP